MWRPLNRQGEGGGGGVTAAIIRLNGDKAPDPDAFPLVFWSFSWDFVKDEVMGFFKGFYEHKKFVKSLNATFLVLISKKCNANNIKNLRPINLVGGPYKILTKVLANRIKKVMGMVISQSHNAFIEGRQILEVAFDATQPGSHSRLSNRWPRRAPQRTSLKLNTSSKAKPRSEPFLIILLNLSF